MVDLHESFRPANTTAPLPLDELAARVRRRKRRRRASAAGLAVVTVAVAALAVAQLPDSPSETVTVADGIVAEEVERSTGEVADQPSDPPREPTTSTDGDRSTDSLDRSSPTAPPEATPSTGSTNAPAGSDAAVVPLGEPHPLTTPGLRTSAEPTSEWHDGYCVQIEVVNDTGEDVAWQVGLDLGGTIDALWNASAEDVGSGTYLFSGDGDHNATVAAGAATSFGTCVDLNR